MIESMCEHFQPVMSPTNLNLDDMFSFLKDDSLDIEHQTQEALDQINTEFTLLNQLLDEDMVSTRALTAGLIRGSHCPTLSLNVMIRIQYSRYEYFKNENKSENI